MGREKNATLAVMRQNRHSRTEDTDEKTMPMKYDTLLGHSV